MFELKDRAGRLFGREADLAFLVGRAAATGLTAIVARPQMGKSWVMVEAARRLSLDAAQPALVGFAEADEITSDLLLRAVADLYERWLGEASAPAQLKQVWWQQKDRLLPAVAKLAGDLAESIPGIGKPLGGLIGKALDGLVTSNEDLKTGRLVLPPLQYDQARDLVRVVAQASGRRICLFLCDWQLSADPAKAAAPLQSFVRKRDDWPHCHIFLSLDEATAAEAPLRDIEAGEAGAAIVHILPPIDLSAPEEAKRAGDWLRQTVPAAAPWDDAMLARLIDGYPGVIDRWVSNEQRTTMKTLPDLSRVADDAQAFRFRELEALLGKLDKDARRLAIRLALLPLARTVDGWAALRREVIEGLDEALLDDLCDSKVLETANPPSYGHGKRARAAGAWFAQKRPVQRRQEAERLCLALGRRIEDVSPSAYQPAAALRELDAIAALPEFDPWARALARAASALFGKPVPIEPLLTKPPQAEGAGCAGAVLLAMGLCNSFYFAGVANDWPGAEKLLGSLVALAAADPTNPAIAHQLATALDNALNAAREANECALEERLLAHLHKCMQGAPENAELALTFARGLYNTLRHRDEDKDTKSALALLQELRSLSKQRSSDAGIAEALGRGLYQLGCVSDGITAPQKHGLQRELFALIGDMHGVAWFERILAQRDTWLQA
jgi:hypothetical protein